MWSGDCSAASSEFSYTSTMIAESETDFSAGFEAQAAERSLMAAVLFDGAQSYLAFVTSKSSAQRAKYHEAYSWVHRHDCEYVFSFQNVCECLGLDPDYVRLGLINCAGSARKSTKEWRRLKRY